LHEFNLFTILGILYPLLTLLLLNTTFKYDFFPLAQEEPTTTSGPGRLISPYNKRENHIKLIALYFAKNNIRGGTGILFTLAVLSAGLLVAGIFIDLMAEHRRTVEQVIQEVGRFIAGWATGADDEQARFLIHDRPALVSAILIVLLVSMPFLACLGSFNQLAGDIQYKGLRYLLLRTERMNIFLGRFLGTALFTMIVLAVLFAVLFFYLAFKADYYPAGLVAVWLLQGYGALVFLALPYIALCSWISAALDSPFVSLVICELVTVFPIVFVTIAVRLNENFQYLGYVTPWPLKFKLLHHNPLVLGGTIAAMLMYSIVFLGLGMRHFQRRDL